MKRELKPHTYSQIRRGGAALIIVLAMTGMLMFLGFFFFSYISAERNSAAWFALNANKQVSESDYFDFALQQVLIGPPDDLKNSALYGRKWSIIPNMLGSFGSDLKPLDLHPFSGRGIHVRYQGDNTGEGLPTDSLLTNDEFRFDYDGLNDSVNFPFRRILNFSPAANPVTASNVPFTPLGQRRHPDFVSDFEPDAGYTYPDINSMFLGYFALIDASPDPANTDLRKVWIPSFHRPQYLPRQSTPTLYTDSAFRNRVLRPHRESRVQLKRFNGTEIVTNNVRRYVDAGGFDTTFTNATEGPDFGFPFVAPASTGIWQDSTNWAVYNTIDYEGIDVDGITANGNEAIILDLDHRVEVMPDGTRRIPMFYITIMDADGLLNLNAAGNLFGEETSLTHARGGASSGVDTAAFGNGRFITQSNLGLSPGELNLGRALYRPLPAAILSTTRTGPDPSGLYDDMFNYNPTSHQVTQVDMANMELARLLVGVADGNALNSDEVVAGRWGEARSGNRLEVAVAGQQPPMPPFPRTTWNTPFFPAPGRTNIDDNSNYGTGGGKARTVGTYTEDPIFGPLGIGIPSVVHPIDSHGVAPDYIATPNFSSSFATTQATEAFILNETLYTSLSANNTHGKIRMARQPGAASNNPSRWPAYSTHWELQVVDTSILTNMRKATAVQPWFQGTSSPGALQSTTSNGGLNLFLADEPDEVVIEPALRDLNYDALFSVGEMSYLHMNDTDWLKLGTTSRLGQLVEFNFDRSFNLTTTSPSPTLDYGWWLRSQFTTDSFDRWEFAYAPPIGSQPGISTTPRGWEYSPLRSDNTRLLFPPEFGSIERFTSNDPFRPEWRQWLTIERNRKENFTNFPLPQRRLNINRFLDKDARGNFVERHLTPHPVFEAGDMDTNGILDLMYASSTSVARLHSTVPAQVSFGNMQNNKFVQEWWAKYDRQRLARDIYVLLYTLGGGDHTKDPTTDPLAHGSDADEHQARCKEMAQFAVNYVDALDRDSVITEFVYDTDLSDGWDITGEKNVNGEFVDSSGETASVFGVEMQQLTFSESLWTAFENNQTTDSNKTPWDDASGTDIQFLFVELRNASPFATNFADGTWRLRRIVGDDDFEGSETDDISAAFSTNAAITEIEAGANFWIGSHNVNDDQLPAAILGDVDGNSTYEAGDVFCPSRQPQDPTNPGPICQLDLCHSDHSTYFQKGNGTDPGYFLAEAPPAPGTGNNFRLVLERRLNPHGNGSLDNDVANPWVPVDYMRVEMNSSVLDIFGGGTDIALGELQKATSRERRQPFDSDATVEHPEETNGRSHTFGPASPLTYNDAAYTPYVDANEATPEINGVKTYTLWQPHFDRDFTSVYELLSLPLVGPDKLTQKLAEDNRLNGKNTAFTKFAAPDLGSGLADPEDRYNYWYRLLEFLEVPTSVQAHLREDLPFPRTPAKINLNTIRHPGVLAALIDDDYHLNTFRTPAQVLADSDNFKTLYPYLQLRDRVETARHWYEQFMHSRDRIDPVSGLPLPGIPGSRPFRPLSYVNTTGTRDARATLEHTVLRSLPFNNVGAMGENSSNLGVFGSDWVPADQDASIDAVIARRGLFEARTDQDVGVDAVDFHTRTRLLNKIANNTTVRSNVFYCWIEVRFHEAAEDEFGNAQVGGPLDTSVHAPKRAFFVLDRSKLEEAWDPRTRSFDWRKFVTFRKVL